MPANTKVIKYWMKRIDSSDLPTASFFVRYDVPFSRAQFFRYKKLLDADYEFKVPLKRGGNQKIGEREELFLRGLFMGGAVPSIDQLRETLESELSTVVGRTAMRQTLDRIFPDRLRPHPGRPANCALMTSTNSLGGFELIVAIAYHLKWPERAGKVIADAVRDHKRSQRGKSRTISDVKGRNRVGRFTSRYNSRADVRASRFASVSDNRKEKNWASMSLMHDQATTLHRKSLAMLSLPIITGNGQVRSVNLPLGQNLDDLCGFNYKQATINKFLSEMKYLGIADRLLRDLPEFWQKCWGKDISRLPGPALCYYVDGNTKAVWSSKRVKQNKVTMLGRVMGCLEQVFIHDGLGHPVYFETYSGHAPVGEYILSLFEKIEATLLEVPGSKTSVCRAIVMDAASNSVKTLRAFAAQEKYHYITTLDDNQWSERRVRNPGYPIRYYGRATLRDLEFELQDSTDKGYMIVVRAIKINWDNGKQTVLLTSLSKDVVDATEVVWSYFKRWPAQELRFREKKAAVSLNRVCGYGKKLVTNERVKDKLDKLTIKKERLENELTKPNAAIIGHDKALAVLIPKERRLREKTAITNGSRKIPRAIRKQFTKIGQKIRFFDSEKKKIEMQYKKQFKSYRKTQKEWLRLQSKKTVYQHDVELDQIVTYYRASLAHICAYFIQNFLDGKSLSLIMLFQRVAHLQAGIKESKLERTVTLRENKQDPEMMKILRRAIVKLNELKIIGNGGRVYQFQLV